MPEVPLQALQSWMQAVVQHPGGAAAGIASTAARSHLDVEPSDVVASTAKLGPHERLELYNRGYHARLLECLRTAYPALLEMVGPELFEAFARDYLAARPPRSYTLLALTHGFADHLQATRPDEDAPGPEPWVDLIVDVARAEQAFVAVFEGAGSEGQAWLRPEGLSEEPLLAARLQIAPAFRLLSTRFALAEFLLATRRGERETPYPPAREGGLALTRRDFVVILTPLDRAQRDVLQALAGGASIAGAAETAGVDPLEAWAWVRAWSSRVFFRSLE